MENKPTAYEIETVRRMHARAECHLAAAKRELEAGNVAMAQWETAQAWCCQKVVAEMTAGY